MRNRQHHIYDDPPYGHPGTAEWLTQVAIGNIEYDPPLSIAPIPSMLVKQRARYFHARLRAQIACFNYRWYNPEE